MATSDVYKNILDANQVEDSVIQLFKDWTKYYLRELERQRNRVAGNIPLPKSITRINRFSRVMMEDQLPSIVVVSPGLAGSPTKDGSGNYRVTFELGIALIISARDQGTVNANCKLYTAALRAIMLQQKINLPGFRGTTWVDERYDDLPAERTRTLSVGQSLFEIEFGDVVNWKKGPKTPTGDPLVAPPDWPIVGDGKVVVEAIKQ